MFPSRLFLLGLFISCNAAYKSNETFDYIIVGGGPAGLLLANRLSENPDVSVVVIEAGGSAFNNPNVTRVDNPFTAIGTEVDWSYKSAPQKYVSNRTFTYNAGKALGGTTTINGMTYLRAEKEQIDAWEDLGNPGWNWDTLYKYYRSQEHFQLPDDETASNGGTFEESYHGFEAELAVGWSQYFMEEGIFAILKETSENLGVPWNIDANGGRMDGFSTWPLTLNASTNIREDAARAFYYPIAENRPNLRVFLNTTAIRIVWGEKDKNGALQASGVQVVSETDSIQMLSASDEVILSAGSLRSPALLELSGVGNPSVLGPLGIDTLLNLPSVGANLQDQPNNLFTYESPDNWTGYPSFVTFVTASDLFGDDLITITAELRANATLYAERIVADAPANETTIEIEERLIRHQIDLVFTENSTIPLAEILFYPGPQSISSAFWSLLPFSRGNVHIKSTDPLQPPSINPNFLQFPIDTYMQAAVSVKVREYFATAPLSSHVTTELTPGFGAVPQDAGWRDDAWSVWFQKNYGVNNHPVSTCAMRSKEWGGVVDSEGRLYGVRNVRIVDASIFPTQISGHLSASVYAIAGKIARKITG